ncbi:MAG: O-antigen ligase family protein [Chitinophagaceae bacterium]
MINDARDWLYKEFVLRKLNSRFGAILLGVIAIVISFAVVNLSFVIGPVLVALLAGLILVFICLNYPLLGFYIIISISCFAFFPERLLGVSLPISTGIELLVFIVFVGIILQRKNSPSDNRAFFKSPASIAILMFFLFFLVEAFNSNMYSLAGWAFYVRRYIIFSLIYFVAFRLLDDIKKVKFFLKFWIAIASFCAIYTCKQQWLGFFNFEHEWLTSDPHLIALYFQGGSFRKFSFLSDPAANGILMGAMCLFCLLLGLGQTSSRKKRTLYVMAFFMFLAMGYSGTRTASVMVPLGVALYTIMTFNNPRTLAFLVMFIFIAMFTFFGPFKNSPSIYRMRTTFMGSQEESLNIRDVNRKYIQPYIYKNPIGGGLATSSSEGMSYNPGHPLAGFPPDSGLLKTAIETGWIGYTLAMIYYFLILFQGVHYYYKAHDPQIRLFYVAITATLIAFIMAQYSQVAIGQVPMIFYFYPVIALLTRLLLIDKKIEHDSKIEMQA